MEGFAKNLADFIIERETPRLNNIMREVAEKIQGDMVAVTYSVIDAFYADYRPEVYIRTDEYKAKHNNQKNKKGQFRQKKSDMEYKRGRDVSLASAIKTMEASNQPAIGVCRPIDGTNWSAGAIAGVVFDESYFAKRMKHSVKGDNFTEWDIVEDFLWGVHGNEAVATTDPSAGLVLYEYIDSYKPRFDKHYNDACKKIKK